MKPTDRVKLLHGPYRAPSLRVGDRATCLFRDCDVVVTSWTDAPLSWPRCRRAEGKGHPSLLVDEELARAIRSESAASVCYWWGVSEGVVWRWRKALAVGRTDNPGSARLIRVEAEAGADATRGVALPAEQVEQRRQRAIEQSFGQANPGYHGPRWTEEELALLGTASDAEIAERTGKSRAAVRAQRVRRKITAK